MEGFLANDILLVCRQGFEGETAQEITQFASELGIYGYVKTESNSGFVLYCCYDGALAQLLATQLNVNELIFARDAMLALPLVSELDPSDRVSGLLEALGQDVSVSRIEPWLIDTNEGKSLAKLSRKLVSPLKQALSKKQQIDTRSPYILNLLFMAGDSAYVGLTHKDHLAKWCCGIAHLKMPTQAPSRSTLKLDEAILFFLNDAQQKSMFGTGKTAVDLGACPGGWSYQLVKRDLLVYAIDNGDMAPSLMKSGQVEHIKADGFHYWPPHAVNWLVCDMVEKPLKVAELMAHWVARGDTEAAIFNLKLPMKKRYDELMLCAEVIDEVLLGEPSPANKRGYHLAMKQLYHDREEVTCYLHKN